MTSEHQYLAMYLDAPMQSWGHMSRFDRRTTLPWPTRSGVLGILCAAMGRDRADRHILRELDDLTMTVYTLRQERVLTDFHTVGGGYDKKKEKQFIVPKASGASGSTVVSRREYLLGSRYGVVLAGVSQLISRVSAALQNPAWGIWLGRKSCIPASPVFQGVFSDREAALRKLKELAGTTNDSTSIRCVKEVLTFDQGTDTINDRPVDFAKREFVPRRIVVE